MNTKRIKNYKTVNIITKGISKNAAISLFVKTQAWDQSNKEPEKMATIDFLCTPHPHMCANCSLHIVHIKHKGTV